MLYFRYMTFSVVLIFGVVFSPPLTAQKYLEEYQAYNEALAAGDADNAATHAYNAWQAAEVDLGADNVTAILAYNFGQLVIFNRPRDALIALRRADQLLTEGIAELPGPELKVYLAYAEFAVSEGDRRKRRELLLALEALDGLGATATPELAAMWLIIARGALASKDYTEAAETSAKAEKAMITIGIADYHLKAEALLIRGVATLVPSGRTSKDVQDAHLSFSNAIRLFPPQKDRKSFDPLLAKLLAWNATADAALGSLGLNDYPVHDDPDHPDNLPAPPLFERPELTAEDCNIIWEKRAKARFPVQAAHKGYIGGAIVIYDIGDDLKTENVELLSEVPIEIFSNEVVQTVKKWRLKSAPLDHASCWKDLRAQFSFVLRD